MANYDRTTEKDNTVARLTSVRRVWHSGLVS